MVAALWQRIWRADGVTAEDEGMRRVAFRLAAQTVVLILIMLIVLEAVVYLTTRDTLLSSLEMTLKARAAQPDGTACAILHLPCAGGGPPFGPRQPQRGNPAAGQRPFSGGRRLVANPNPSEASAVYVNSDLRVIHSDGPSGTRLLDKNGVRDAIATKQAQCCSTQTHGGESFLVYSSPLFADGKAVGAVQTIISEHEYQVAMSTLLQKLLLVALLGLFISGVISVLMARRALRPIRAAIQRQRDFVADAAHELRTPLAIQRTVAEVGMNGGSEEDRGATLEQMLAENRHLTRLVDDLSLLARADSHAVSIERRPLELSSLIAETTAELEPLAEEQGVTLHADVEGDIRVIGDVLRLRQLLLILLDNALKHTPQGGAVSVRLTAQGGRAHLEVRDSGPGIDRADLPHIFDRFYRADRARTGDGSGLGLSIGQWIAEVHGGQIGAENAPGGGAVFTITLPLARVPAPQAISSRQ